jgi:hypothetical protein
MWFILLSVERFPHGMGQSMKSLIRKRTYAAIYRLLDKVSPLPGDCGLLCGGICCTGGEQEAASQGFALGIYLLPGEEKLFTKKEDWIEWSWSDAADGDFPDSWSGRVYFIRCKNPPSCPRRMRPLQCRFFPLAPHIDGDGALRLILFPMWHLPYVCPVIEKRLPLSQDFVRAVFTVWKHLVRDPLIRDLVEYDSGEREESSLTFLV